MKPKIIIFGAGEAGKAAYAHLKADHEIIGYTDNDKNKQGTYLNGYPIKDANWILSQNFDFIYIASEFFEQIKHQLEHTFHVKSQQIHILPAHAIKQTKLGQPTAKKNALKLLELVTATLNTSALNYYVDAGTLLGIVRDNALIPWDDDLDIAINSQDTELCFAALNELLPVLDKQFGTPWEIFINKASSTFHCIDKGNISSYKLRPCSAHSDLPQLDVFIKYVDAGSMYYVISSRGFSMPSKHLLLTEGITFNNCIMNIPSEATQYLEAHYGSDWHTPKKDWNLSMISSATVFKGE
ncbi:LicD family protein [Pseudoalteromonas sp. SCSIO 43201]|uniref:nucleoside-diphosphate sugar epimerase/dehydratase n=1 Tax=Pseudoalteromonas sp. SCSIO 43201 TaxID=2822842 RepID=UPI002076178A|nr:LicD family protein [Pseudoalteromonas sp. SCSIO 43201]USD29625.1 LicD family protein [Pseudoalteromonas sp. SCSIO 43201]